ncbi:MAG TPA: peptidase domain-containing ABC transporter [Xanthomonadales bacterium]|nr:peptidase domain-containing ABC transporter [Xanthomonadales bacterium]
MSARRRLPLVLQQERAECVLACIAMVARAHGVATDLRTLRTSHPASSRGVALSDAKGVLEALGLEVDAVRLELEDLARIESPAILHWNFEHYVVLRETNRRGLVLHDPARGVRVVPWAEAGRHVTGVALLVHGVAGDATCANAPPPRRPTTLWRLLPKSRRILRDLGAISLLTLLLQATTVLMPWGMQLALDSASGPGRLLWLAAAGLVAIAAYQAVVTSLRTLVLAELNARLGDRMGRALHRHLLRLPLNFFEQRQAGDVLARFGSLEAVRVLFSGGLLESLVDAATLVVVIAALLAYEPSVAAVCGAGVAAIAVLRFATLRRTRQLMDESVGAKAWEDSVLLENTRGIAALKASRREPARFTLWKRAYRRFLNASLRLSRIGALFDFARPLLAGLEVAALLLICAQAHATGAMTVGGIAAVLALRQRFAELGQRLVDRVFQLRTLDVHVDRIDDIAGEPVAPPSPVESDGTLAPGELLATTAGFAFPGERRRLFGDVRVAARPGQVVAIVGESGSGKTTLLKVISGLLHAPGTRIRIGARAAGGRTRTARLALVLQNDLLFSGSIRENITYFRASGDEARMREAAMVAGIHDDIERLPMAWETALGEDGAGFSGGQRQRLLLARALYQSPDVLFLDEATSQVDVECERRIFAALRARGITIVMAAHRPDAIAAADVVLELRDGALHVRRASSLRTEGCAA